MISTLKDIQQISYGSCGGYIFWPKTLKIKFVSGKNYYVQLGTGDVQSVSIPKEINSQYSIIWREEFYGRAKSARK